MVIGDVGKICRGEQDPWPQGPPSETSGLSVLKILIIVLVAIAVGGTAWYFIKKRNEEQHVIGDNYELIDNAHPNHAHNH